MMCEWYSRSRRRTAPFSPGGAVSYSATMRSLYSGLNVRRFGLAAGSVDGFLLVMRVVLLSMPYQANPTKRDVSPNGDREGFGTVMVGVIVGSGLQTAGEVVFGLGLAICLVGAGAVRVGQRREDQG